LKTKTLAIAVLSLTTLAFSTLPGAALPAASKSLPTAATADTSLAAYHYHPRPRRVCRWTTTRVRGPHGRVVVKRVQRCGVR